MNEYLVCGSLTTTRWFAVPALDWIHVQRRDLGLALDLCANTWLPSARKIDGDTMVEKASVMRR
jgi:hypothetical protein